MELNQDVVMQILCQLAQIDAGVAEILRKGMVKTWYTTEEMAKALGKAPFTVREWCRHGRIYAEKRPSGRGKSGEWMISYDELKRIQEEGLLPERKPYRYRGS